MENQKRQTYIENRKARHDYSVIDTIEAGLALKGTEVKSLRAGKANLTDSYARIINGEMVIIGLHISPYDFGNINNHDPMRNKTCLLHRKETEKLRMKVEKDGFTLVPLKIYFNSKGFAKIELGICKGKKQYDKREALKQRENKRELSRVLKSRVHE